MRAIYIAAGSSSGHSLGTTNMSARRNWPPVLSRVIYLTLEHPVSCSLGATVMGNDVRRVPFCTFISREETMKTAIALLGLSMLIVLPNEASAWGDDGHKT